MTMLGDPVTLHAELGRLCLAASDTDTLARRLVATLSLNLRAVAGWVGVPDPDGTVRVHDAMGSCEQGPALASTVEALTLGVGEAEPCAVRGEVAALLPGLAGRGDGLCVAFRVPSGGRGWLLLVGPPGDGLTPGAEALLAAAASLLAVTVAWLQARGRAAAVAAPAWLAARPPTRGVPMPAVSAAAGLPGETLHHLAAGLAHEINNPLGAALANLDYVYEGLRGLEDAPGGARDDLVELTRATADAVAGLRRLAGDVTARLDKAFEAQRAAVRSAVDAAVQTAIADQLRAGPCLEPPSVRLLQPVACGVPLAHVAAWVRRILVLLADAGRSPRTITVLRTSAGPCVRILSHGQGPDLAPALDALAQELSTGGARVHAAQARDRALVELVLPPALGDSGVTILPAAGVRR
jgi:hypothetical protein